MSEDVDILLKPSGNGIFENTVKDFYKLFKKDTVKRIRISGEDNEGEGISFDTEQMKEKIYLTIEETYTGEPVADDIINQFITILTLFVSFSMAYLSIIVSSSSKNIDELKGTPSKERFMANKDPYSLYQILISEITYTLVFEIIFLIFCVFEKFLIGVISWEVTRILICLDVAF